MFTFVYHSTTIAQEYCSSFTNVMQLKESESKGRRHHQPKGRQRERPTINAPCGGALVGAPTPPSPPPSGRARGSLAGNYQFAPPMAARPDGSPNANKEQYLTGARFPTRAPLGRGRGSTAGEARCALYGPGRTRRCLRTDQLRGPLQPVCAGGEGAEGQ